MDLTRPFLKPLIEHGINNPPLGFNREPITYPIDRQQVASELSRRRYLNIYTHQLR